MNGTQVDLKLPVTRKRGVRALFERCPVVIIAVVLAIAAQAGAQFFGWAGYIVPFVPFVPGAIQRTNIQHFLIAMVCGVLVFALQAGLRRAGVEHVYFLSYIVYPAAAMLAVAAMEWWLRGSSERVRLGAVLAASLAAAAIFAIVQTSLACTEATLTVPIDDGGIARYSAANLVYIPLECLLLWLAIPMGLTASERRRSVVLGASAAAIVLYVACFTVLVYDVARQSLAGEGPFTRSSSAILLAQRGNDVDLAALWQAVETADWDEPLYDPNDYRFRCVNLLARHDPARTAQRLANLLETENKRQLANATASLIADNRNYEAAPVLLRFACADGDPACLTALEQLRVPQVAMPLMFWAAVEAKAKVQDEALQSGHLDKDVAAAQLKVDAGLRQKLVSLLGDIKGSTFADWEQHYDQVIEKRPTPLAKEQDERANRVIRAFSSFWQSKARWEGIRRHRVYAMAIKKMQVAGLTKQVDLIESSAKSDASKPQLQLPPKDTPLYDALMKLDEYIGHAQAEIKEPAIDLEAQGIDGLENAVANYRRWVDEQYKIELGKSPAKPGEVKSEK